MGAIVISLEKVRVQLKLWEHLGMSPSQYGIAKKTLGDTRSSGCSLGALQAVSETLWMCM